ncbi:hypothetical protein L1887_57745 [Cichorium endivia]|nr:hypothetical protein L1887_57745 [Cichorium endivia]
MRKARPEGASGLEAPLPSLEPWGPEGVRMLVEHLLGEDRGVVRVTGDTYTMGMHALCHGHWRRLGIDLPPVYRMRVVSQYEFK